MTEATFQQRIRIEQDALVIESFKTTDSDVVAYFKDRKMQDYERLLEKALKAGTIALGSVAVADKIDYVKKQFGELDNRFSTNLKDKIREMDQKYEDYFGEKGKVSEVIKAYFGEGGKIVKEIFDPTRDGTPLFVLSQELKRELKDLSEKLGVKEEVDQLKSKTTLKGYDFEAICGQKLSEIARLNGDDLENTTQTMGTLPRSKKGDYVVTIAGKIQKKIVFETKNVSDRWSPSKIHESVEESMRNRQASYGVFVVKNVEALPESIGWFNEYCDNQLVCALSSETSEDDLTNTEILLIAYRWAKMRLLLESATDQKLGVSKVKEFVDDLRNQLQTFSTIKTKCGVIETSAKDIKRFSDELKEHIDEGTKELLKTITEISHD